MTYLDFLVVAASVPFVFLFFAFRSAALPDDRLDDEPLDDLEFDEELELDLELAELSELELN